MKCFRRPRYAIALIALLGLSPSAARAADHSNLEEGLPTSLADATPLPFLARELQLASDYNRVGEVDSLEFEPRFEFGVIPNGQLALHAPLIIDEEGEPDLGNLSADVLYNLNQESIALPSFAVVGGLAAPTAPDSDQWRPSAKLFVTKSIPYTTYWMQLHANAAYSFNEDAERGPWNLKGGASFRVTTSSIGILGYTWDQGGDESPDVHWIEPGLRFQVTPLWVVSAGSGVGLGDERTRFRGTIGVQWSGLVLPF